MTESDSMSLTERGTPMGNGVVESRPITITMALRTLALYTLHAVSGADAREAWDVIQERGSEADRLQATILLADRLMGQGKWTFHPRKQYGLIIGLEENDGRVIDLTSYWPRVF